MTTGFSEVHSQFSLQPGYFEELNESYFFPIGLETWPLKGTKSWFSNHGVTVSDWPSNRPDLNLIEILGRQRVALLSANMSQSEFSQASHLKDFQLFSIYNGTFFFPVVLKRAVALLEVYAFSGR